MIVNKIPGKFNPPVETIDLGGLFCSAEYGYRYLITIPAEKSVSGQPTTYTLLTIAPSVVRKEMAIIVKGIAESEIKADISFTTLDGALEYTYEGVPYCITDDISNLMAFADILPKDAGDVLKDFVTITMDWINEDRCSLDAIEEYAKAQNAESIKDTTEAPEADSAEVPEEDTPKEAE